jgi:SAM-dependent MidA family methyltransferase
MGVVLGEGGFVWSARPAPDTDLVQACRRLAAAGGGWDDGYVSEYCPRLPAWSGSMVGSLRRGVALWFDYGLPRAHYYLPERHEGTLVCHFRHHAHDDPLRLPGLEDISAWVDFTSLAEACIDAGCDLGGFTTQAWFLAGLRVEEEMQHLAGGDDTAFARLANQARRLMLPGEMGERFKAMAWTRGVQAELSGFRLRDLRHSL